MSYFAEQLARDPNGLAITDLTATRSWRELDHNVNCLSRYLLGEAGMRPGEHIALAITNRIEFVEAMLAGMQAGLWVTPINTHLTPAEIDYIRRDCDAGLIFHDREMAECLFPASSGRALDVVELIKDLAQRKEAIPLAPSSPAGGNMLYTSGTTGRPKGVKRAKPDTLGEMITRMRSIGITYDLTGKGPHLVTGPLYHAAPGMFAIYDLLNGAPMVIMPRWNNETFFAAVRDYRVTTTHLVPTMFVRLLQARDQGLRGIDISSLQYVLHGAAPIGKAVKQRMIDWWGPILTEYWGGTESGVVTLVNSEDWSSHPGTVGRPIATFEVYVGDEQGNPTGEEEGLLFCRHRQLQQVFSYHKDPEKTARAHPQPYVFSLGDIGRVDASGFVYLSDRESHMIISGGVNIYPAEVEQALMLHADIVDAAVFGIPNPEWGEEVMAVVELRAGVQPSPALAEEIRAFARGEVAGFKVPRSIEFVDKLPRNPAGKVFLHELKKKYGAGATRG